MARMQNRKANVNYTANLIRDPQGQFTAGYTKITKTYVLKTLFTVLVILGGFTFLLFLL
jgi:hypothetical protein